MDIDSWMQKSLMKTLLTLEEARANSLKTDWDNLRIPVPWFVGRRMVEPSIDDLIPLIDWAPFSSAILDEPFDDGAARELYEQAQVMLGRVAKEKLLTARGVYGFWPANTSGDDIVVYKDDARATALVRFHMLRQRESIDGAPNRSLADFIAPKESFAPDYIGAFAVTAGIGAEELTREYERQIDSGAIIAKAIAERLADAFAEYLHAQARKDWNCDEDRGIRTSLGDPACPDRSDMPALFRLLHAPEIGITLSESFVVTPAASVSGLYLSHPQAKSFDVGPLGRDQVEDYATRKGVPIEQVEPSLASNLGY